jgi:hypothetical protein
MLTHLVMLLVLSWGGTAYDSDFTLPPLELTTEDTGEYALHFDALDEVAELQLDDWE